ncbi:MAG: choice-of-anchor tandem repeat GloVer-containing protein [Terriglobales bacterium]|jgi:uncharacterized repeat protein (TIGR03803 family)
MHSAKANAGTTICSNISDVNARFHETTWTVGAIPIRVVLALVLCALLMIAARPTQAQTDLYGFKGGSDGAYPLSPLTFDNAGNLYGMTNGGAFYGQPGYGTVFELSPNGSGGWNESVLYNFCSAPNCADGATPTFSSLVFNSQGNLYGTASAGGAYGYGVVFELSPSGSNWTETVLYSFANDGDGAYPQNGVIFDHAGNLYGTTCNCGSGGNGNGGVFELSPSAGGWTEQLIYPVDATASYAGLTIDTEGNIFGTTLSTVFELSPNGNGGWTPAVIHTFDGPNDGDDAQGTPAFDHDGNLYGTTTSGANGNGTVYKLTLVTKGTHKGNWTEKILHRFTGRRGDGQLPFGGVVVDAAGNVYGTTVVSGSRKANAGIVYELVPPVGNGKYDEDILCQFLGYDGSQPYSSLILDGSGNLYGTASYGGGYGDVFEVTP